MSWHKTANELPEIGRLVIISDGDNAMTAWLDGMSEGKPVWHLFPLAYAAVIPFDWQYLDLVTGEVS